MGKKYSIAAIFTGVPRVPSIKVPLMLERGQKWRKKKVFLMIFLMGEVNRISPISFIFEAVMINAIKKITRIKEIEGLENHTELKHLDLEGNKIRNIEGLENLINLHVLSLRKNAITWITGLDSLVTLIKLRKLKDSLT